MCNEYQPVDLTKWADQYFNSQPGGSQGNEKSKRDIENDLGAVKVVGEKNRLTLYCVPAQQETEEIKEDDTCARPGSTPFIDPKLSSYQNNC